MHKVISAGVRRGLTVLLAVADTTDTATGKPFTQADIVVPNLESRRLGWTHHGPLIPGLTEPHRHFSMMSLVGAT